MTTRRVGLNTKKRYHYQRSRPDHHHMNLSYPHLGWAQVRWDVNEDVSPAVAAAASTLAAMPGVTYHVGTEWLQLDVPHNAWTTAAWATIQSAPEQVSGVKRIASRELVPRLWQPKQPLYSHQVVAAEFLVAHGGGLEADQMGLGKTRVAIVAAETLAHTQGTHRLPRVIIAPGYTRDVWRRELLAVGAIESEVDFAAAYSRDPRADFDWTAKWWFIHYDIVAAWAGYIGTRRLAAAILDEIHWIKNGRAQRSKGAAAVAGSARARIGLTGTPLSNRPSELWWPLTVIDGVRTWGGPKQFRERYCGAISDGYGLKDMGPTNVFELRTRLASRYIRRTVFDAGVELPPLTRTPFMVELSAAVAAKHEAHVSAVGYDKLVAALVRGSAGQDTLKRITALRKLVARAKVAATIKLVSDMLEAGESVVVFTWMKATADKLADTLARDVTNAWGGLYTVHGDHTQESRDLCVSEFQKTGGVLVATLGALREGVTLTTARNLVIHDLDWVPANILQAEARIYRIGQTQPTQVFWMLASNSIDVMLAQVLVSKSRVMSQTLGIAAAVDAVIELDLPDFVSTVSVEADVSRLLQELGV